MRGQGENSVTDILEAERTLATHETVLERASERVLELTHAWAAALIVQLPIRLAVAQRTECPYLFDEEVQEQVDRRFAEFKEHIPGELVEGLRRSPLLDMDWILARFSSLLEPARIVLFAAGYEELSEPLPLEDDPELKELIEAAVALDVAREMRDDARHTLESYRRTDDRPRKKDDPISE